MDKRWKEGRPGSHRFTAARVDYSQYADEYLLTKYVGNNSPFYATSVPRVRGIHAWVTAQ